MIDDGDLDVPADEEVGSIHNAEVGEQLDATVELVLRHQHGPGSIKAEAEREVVVLQPARFAFPAHAKNRGIYRANRRVYLQRFWQDAGELAGLAFNELRLHVCDIFALAIERQNSQRLLCPAPSVIVHPSQGDKTARIDPPSRG